MNLANNLIKFSVPGNPLAPIPHVVDMWIPQKQVTLLAGHGGSGKSYVALSIAVHVALGRSFGTMATKQAKVLFFSAEDEEMVLRQRLFKICRALDIEPSDLQDKLFLLDASDIDPALHREHRVAINGEQTIVTETPLLSALAKLVQKFDIGLVVIDNASDTYDDDEIKRARVRGFVRSLRQHLARPSRAVLLLAHINKASAQRGRSQQTEDYSGSTAWHNSVRSRLSLSSDEKDVLTIWHIKANLGVKAKPVRIIWNDGVPMVSGSYINIGAEAAAAIESERDVTDKQLLLTLIKDFDNRGERVTTSFQGSATVHRLLKGEKNFPKDTDSFRLMRLLREMESESLIYRRTVKAPDRKSRDVFTCVPEIYPALSTDQLATKVVENQTNECANAIN